MLGPLDGHKNLFFASNQRAGGEFVWFEARSGNLENLLQVGKIRNEKKYAPGVRCGWGGVGG